MFQSSRLVPILILGGAGLLGLSAEARAQQKANTALPGDTNTLPAAREDAIGIPAIALTPRRFPEHKVEDILHMMQTAKRVARGGVSIMQWGDGNLHNGVSGMVGLMRQQGLVPMIGLSPTSLAGGRKDLDMPRTLGGARSFANDAVRRQYVADAEKLGRLRLEYLCLATEINALHLHRPDEYAHWAKAYKEAYKAVKKVSPQTKVFVSFQYDLLRMVDNKQPGKQAEHAKVIDMLRPELDMVGITSYPGEHYPRPEDMPGNYYSYLRTYLKPGDEVMIMEIGWPAIAKNVSDGDARQRDFVRRLPALLSELSPKVTAWSLLHDVRHPLFGSDLSSTGLLTRDGNPRPAFAAWEAIAAPALR